MGIDECHESRFRPQSGGSTPRGIEEVQESSGYRALPGADQTRSRQIVDAILGEHGDDPALADGLRNLLGSRDFQTLDPADQEEMLFALAANPTAEATDRLTQLASDPPFRAFPTRSEAEAAARGAPIPAPADVMGASGAHAPPRPGPNILTATSGASHALDLALELSGAEMAAFGAGLGALLPLAFEMGHGIIEAHEQGRELGRNVAFGQGFARQIGELMGEDSYTPHNQADRDGATTADRVWNELQPSERATLRALPAEARSAFVAELGRRMEALTMRGR
ncbi:MAG: hypothetical protein HYY06_32080 [Deltaproteobacteria bacterium]|nr:hypothetical protein [Deltaproteobacteria bacterium]